MHLDKKNADWHVNYRLTLGAVTNTVKYPNLEKAVSSMVLIRLADEIIYDVEIIKTVNGNPTVVYSDDDLDEDLELFYSSIEDKIKEDEQYE